jgi:prepilin-type N-terminal cleavage/methylation domain-containing protein
MKRINQKGFSLVEIILVLAMAAIMMSIALPSLMKYYKSYKFEDYASQIDYLVKYGKIYAMEHSTNIGVCVDNSFKKLTIYNIGPDRNVGICQNTNTLCKENNHTAPCVIGKLVIDEKDKDDIILIGSNSGNVARIDPRGILIPSPIGGNICISYNNYYKKVVIHRTSIRIEKNSGGCSAS